MPNSNSSSSSISEATNQINDKRTCTYATSKDLLDGCVISSGAYGRGALVSGQGRIVQINASLIPESMEFAAIMEQLKGCEEFPVELHFQRDDNSSCHNDRFAEEKKSDEPTTTSSSSPLPTPQCTSLHSQVIDASDLPEPSSNFTIFVQSSTGAFFPAEEITNASVVAVRPSVVAGLPPGTSVQWYRESHLPNQWIPLAGATRPLFQPTAIDVGYRLHCRLDGTQITHPTVPIRAAANLYAAARHTATAAFVLQGRGPAEGRNVQVAVGHDGRLSLHQQYRGADRVPLAPGPIRVVTAAACQGKELELQLAGVPKDCLLSALCEQEGLLLRLRAPNRMARESLLLAIGIANYDGELSESARLYGKDFSIGKDDELPADEKEASAEEEKDELTILRDKLTRKDKVIAELQRQLAASDAAVRSVEATIEGKDSALDAEKQQHSETRQSLTQCERRLDVLQTERDRMSATHSREVRDLQSQLQNQSQQTANALKAQRALQNETSILSASVEARDGKLQRMAQLQSQLEDAQQLIRELRETEREHEESQKKLSDTKQQVERMVAARIAAETAQQQLQSDLSALQTKLEQQQSLATACHTQMEHEQLILQKLKAERNSYKQRVDSLAKEMNRICKNGVTVRHVEKVLADDRARREEVLVLREQKRKALADLEELRHTYEHSVGISKLAGMDHDSIQLLQRNAELERLLMELTEYVDAKEMQLDTMRQVNAALQTELRELAQAMQTSGDV